MYCGLDFGTSNSLCTVELPTQSKEMKYISFGAEQLSEPSAVFYRQTHLDEPLFGREALDAYLAGQDGRLLRSFKRLLGTKYMASGTKLSSSKKLKFQNLFVSFIQHLKETAEQQVGQEISQVVFGRPVKFSSLEIAHKSGEADLEKIANRIGYKHVEFQFEPIAAAFTHERHLQSEKLAIVADIGGGTSDFSIVRLGPKRKDAIDRKDDILANSGIAIGGTDFDSMLALRQVMNAFGYESEFGKKSLRVPNWPYVVASDWNRIALELYLPQTYFAMKKVLVEAKEKQKLKRFLKLMEERKAHYLLKLVEEAKIELSDKNSTEIKPHFIEDDFGITVNRELFDLSLGDKLKLLVETINEALSAAKIKGEDIDLIIMTGGASAVPIIQKTFVDLFPNADLSGENKMGSVCEGLLHDARRKFGN
ncbi:MAG: Hsp70 family protein [Bacteroidia bacterium]